ncbi:serine threonine- kinase receptor R831 [Chlorella sorokiniana]|uniref:Serine threonine-kinase receptor R831 n=1 Tax=Chlorella sorokiniana TaxID=3076 RepID=A0A2P6TI74_CHLSO|nr:serine threonine- kinase receptor R831 [Chlorella sorokiniana]|eukprot:PRW33966.1 serine threonine- kinase receptor R831 [Chlorella sorokiniana]
MLPLLLATLLAALGGGRRALGYPERGSVLRPPDVSYQSLPSDPNTTWVEVQHTAWGSGLLLDSTKALGTDECVAACLDDPECAWSAWCGLETGCTRLQPPMEYQDCWLYGANCTLAPLVGDSGPQVERDSGTDGCSAEPLSLLISTPVSRTTSFLAPTALALIKLNYSRSNSEEPMLPELKEHIAQCDALLSFGSSGLFGGGGGGASVGSAEHTLLSPEQMSPSLRDWLVNIQDVTVLRHPNGALQELGCGASACVYKALFRGEVVAAKEVDLGRSAAVQAAFLTEAERLHQLRHAHVVALYGVALAGSRGLILMEHCSGRDLHSGLQLKAFGTEERLFSWYRKGRRVALDTAKALNFLHSRSIVHFDIKSSNVLLTGTGTAKLADVGLARMQTRTFLTGLPHMVGTFSWVAPEVLLGGQSCTSAVDIYRRDVLADFGVVLWEPAETQIITGEHPKRGQMRMPRVPEECPQEASDLMVQCMSLDPEQRPTAQQVMQRLAALQNHQEHQP